MTVMVATLKDFYVIEPSKGLRLFFQLLALRGSLQFNHVAAPWQFRLDPESLLDERCQRFAATLFAVRQEHAPSFERIPVIRTHMNEKLAFR
jgi:hypothetical protein